jgi:ATP-binding protein involved in chromosome partitioning
MTTTPSDTQDDRRTAIKQTLADVSVPDVDSDLVSAGIIHEIDLHGGDLTVVVDLSPVPQADSEGVMTEILAAVEGVDGIENARVEQAASEPDVGANVEDFDRVIAVASAKGGVGKSTVATHLAAALAEDSDVAIFDADVHGPNVPRLFDVDGPVYSTAEGRPVPIQHDGLEVMSVGLLESDVPLAWRGAMAHDAVSQLFAETAWHSDDTLVIDLPPGTGDVVLTTLQEVPVDGLVVVTTPFHTSITDTNRTIDLFEDEGIPVLGAVVNMAEFTCECCGEPNDLFEDAVDDLATETLASLPFDRNLQGRPSTGDAPDSIRSLADRVADELDALGSYSPPTDAVDIRGLPPDLRRQRVSETFSELETGEQFHLVSDRDPTPVREYLATLSDTDPASFERFEVERKTPEAWELTTEHP